MLITIKDVLSQQRKILDSYENFITNY